MCVRSLGHHYTLYHCTYGKSLMAHALMNFGQRVLETVNDTDLKASYFNNCITILLNVFLPVQTIQRWQSDKPWVTDSVGRFAAGNTHSAMAITISTINCETRSIVSRNSFSRSSIIYRSRDYAPVALTIGGVKQKK